MTNGQEIESILAIDDGSVFTKAALVDVVDGVYRFLAQGKGVGALRDHQVEALPGVRDAVAKVESITDRLLLSEEGDLLIPERSDGDGVDALVASTSRLAPLRVVIAGLISDLSVESARRAAQSAYAVVQDTIALDEGNRRWGASRGIEARLESLCQEPPDVILLVGGVDGGAVSPLLDITRMLIAAASVLDPTDRPVIIFAGNAQARSGVAELLAEEYEFLAVDNVRPSLDVESLTGVQRELERLYAEYGTKQVPDLKRLAELSAVPLLSSAKAFEIVIRFVARQYELSRGVLGVDLGGSNTQIFACFEDQHYGMVKSGVGMSQGWPHLMEEIEPEKLARWLPFEISDEEVANRIWNKALQPMSLPQVRQDLLLEQAMAREILHPMAQRLVADWEAAQEERKSKGVLPPVDLIIGSGGILANVTNPGQAALILLDALQPTGLSRLVLDHLAVLPAVGAMASLNPLAAAQVLDQDGFLELGTVVAPLGEARIGDIALRFKVTYADESTIEVEVPYGSLEVIPLPLGQTATLELHPTRRFDIGLGRRGRGARVQVKGGTVGVIIDARGRPLRFPPDSTGEMSQAERVQEWLWSIGG
jgi:hypothetical protein